MNNVIKTLFSGSNEKELHRALDKFWRKYKNFNQNNYPLDSNEFIWNSKDIYYLRVFPDISSPANIWNMYDDESDEEESTSNY